jgi:DNA-binding NarL/FixJ family response regulator
MIRSGDGRVTPSIATVRNNTTTQREERDVGTPLTAVVVDQWQLVAMGISTVLADRGITTVAVAADARSGVRAAREHRPSLVVLGATSLAPCETARHLVHLSPRPSVIALVTGAEHTELGQLIAEGVDGLLVRGTTGDELGDAVDRIAKGERFVAPVLLSTLVGNVGPIEPADVAQTSPLLTTREREVLACLAQGRTNRQIAHELFVGMETVKSHLSRLYAKLEARDRHDAVARALAFGLLG